MNRSRRIRSLGALASGLLLAACGGNEIVEEPPPVRPVMLAPAEVEDITIRVEAMGELLAKSRAEVAAQVAGEITEVLADEGDRVEADGVVLEIDPERRNLELDRARARLAEAEASKLEAQRRLRRVRKLSKADAASRAQFEEAETAVRAAASRVLAARAELGVAERALADATVQAPFAGSIARRLVSRGEYVQPGQPLFELVALSPLEVEFHLPEADVSRVLPGQPLAVRVAPWPDEIFTATIDVISPTIDPRTRTLRVKARLENADGRLKPGLFARADLGIETRRDVLLIPEEAVLQTASGPVVFRVSNGNRAERREISLGLIRDGRVEVRDGLAPGDTVVRRGHDELVDGSVVVARNADGTPVVASGPDAASPREVAP